MKLFRYHGLGNDYLVADRKESSAWGKLTSKSTQLICSRHYGVGSDGILVGSASDGARAELRIFNPDGSEAEKSGNGIRIFARYLHDSGQWRVEKPLTIDLTRDQVRVEYLPKSKAYRVEMGKPEIRFARKKVTLPGKPTKKYELTALTIGNPHCVIFAKRLDDKEVRTFGPKLETHRLFPERTNVQWVNVRDDHTLQIRIWERGAGYTEASGSSSCAAFAAARFLKKIGPDAEVQMPGGTLMVNERADGLILLTGPVTSVGTIHLSSDFEAELTRARI